MWQQNIQSPDIFDKELFRATLDAANASRLQIFKSSLQSGHEGLIKQYQSGEPIKEILYKRAWLIDELLIHAWQDLISTPALALVAVGGYGRAELHPGSDIDLMIITKPRINTDIKNQIESYLTFLWDIGLEVGHSVRTVKDSIKEAKADITVATNLMESRLITGNEKLYSRMQKATGARKIWPSRKFFEAKWAEQITRHQKYDGTEHNLEPNIKEGPGGLRDIQMIDWVAKRHFNSKRLRELVNHGFLTGKEYQLLDNGRAFLWRVRFELHLLNKRQEDRLLFDYQRSVAESFGFKKKDNSGIEQFMKMYYTTVKELSRLNEMLLQHFQEEILYARRREKIKPLNQRFQIRNDFIEVKNSNIFKRYPMALLEIFLLMQQHRTIKGVRASTIRLIRESLPLIDNKFRDDIRNKSLFLEIIRQPLRVGHELRRMHRYGVLGKYLPEFAVIEGLMQFDLFHVYTVDEHILFVVRNMRYFGLDEYVDKYPLCHQLLKKLPKQELLYLSGIFHDIAKGRGGDHSNLGQTDAIKFCRNHQLSEYDSRLVGWLVENHLLMSKTAQREDINDPETINRFAAKVRDINHLNYLYLLTVADINGTNPKLWNSWKDALIADLYHKTLSALRRGLENPIDKDELIKEIKDEVRSRIKSELRVEPDTEAIWKNLGDDYFIRHSPDEISRHTRAIGKSNENRLPLILIREKTSRGGTEIFIYTRDRKNVFSHICRILDILGLNVVDARIITSQDGHTLDTFIVLERNGNTISGTERKKEIKTRLKQGLSDLGQPVKKVTTRRSRQLENFRIPTDVKFSHDDVNHRTVMVVNSVDRPGLLASIGAALEQHDIDLEGAKIATYGERAEDVFFISDKDNQINRDQEKMENLRKSIIDSLTA